MSKSATNGYTQDNPQPMAQDMTYRVGIERASGSPPYNAYILDDKGSLIGVAHAETLATLHENATRLLGHIKLNNTLQDKSRHHNFNTHSFFAQINRIEDELDQMVRLARTMKPGRAFMWAINEHLKLKLAKAEEASDG